jgi:hypothetical protein
MRWIFIVLFAINLIYFGWELNRQTGIDLGNSMEALVVPPGVKQLVLIRELPSPPQARHMQEEGQGNIADDESVPGEDEPSPVAEINTDDVKINEDFDNALVTQLPDISVPGIPDNVQQERIMCFSYGPFTDNLQAEDLMAWFQDRRVNVQQRLETGQENQLFWIYLKPQASRDNAIQAIEDLKSKGITDYRLIETGDLRNAISLGLFSTQASVNRRLNELKNKGYQPVVIPYRDAKAIYWLDVKLTDQQDILNQMFTEYPARYNSVPMQCGEIAIPQVNP